MADAQFSGSDVEDFGDCDSRPMPGSTSDSPPFPVPYAPGPDAVDVTQEQDGGVMKEVLTPGPGSGSGPGSEQVEDGPGFGDRVTVHYTGRLASDGSKFDSSRDPNRGPPFEFNLGKGEVIKAWEIGVATMKRGEVARFTCGSDLCYGKRGSPPNIPPDADLVFDVELLGWRGEDLSKAGDGGIVRSILTPSKSLTTPNEGAAVRVRVVGRLAARHEEDGQGQGRGGRVFFEERELEFRLDYGEAGALDLPRGVEEALYKFHKGERSVVRLRGTDYGFGDAGCEKLGVPAGGADLVYELELLDFVKAKDRWEMDNDEKLKQAEVYKNLGTDLLKSGDLRSAEAKYKKAVEYLDDGGAETADEKVARTRVLLAVRLNLALVALKLDELKAAENECDKALELEPGCEKALFRRGQARLAMHEPERAVRDFQRVLALNPDNKAAVQQVAACKRAVAQMKERDRRVYRKMFELYSAGDEAGSSAPSSCPKPETWEADRANGLDPGENAA